jgi:hypothetical protein
VFEVDGKGFNGPSHFASRIARIATDSETPERLRATQIITSWLGQDRDFAAATPLPGADLVEVDAATTVTFWTYYPQPAPGTG